MKKVLNNIFQWFNDHWHKRSFKLFVIFAIMILYLDIFLNKEFIEFIRFLVLIALKDLITNLVHNDNVVTALGIAVVGALAALFKKNDKK